MVVKPVSFDFSERKKVLKLAQQFYEKSDMTVHNIATTIDSKKKFCLYNTDKKH